MSKYIQLTISIIIMAGLIFGVFAMPVNAADDGLKIRAVRKVLIVSEGQIERGIEMSKELGIPEVAEGIPPALKDKVTEDILPYVYEEIIYEEPDPLKEEMKKALEKLGADIAEYYPVSDESIEAGDVVSVSNKSGLIMSAISTKYLVEKSSQPYDQKLMGVISSNHGVIINEEANIDSKENLRLVALAGRVLVKVSLEGGLIKPGDLLTSSSIPGVAMKTTMSGTVIGKALEGFVADNPSDIGKIMIFVNVGWYGNDLSVGEGNGQLVNLSPEQLRQGLAQLGLIVSEYGTLEVGTLKAVVVETQRLKVSEKIQLRDQSTDEIYCTWIENGEWVKRLGECQDTLINTDSASENPTETGSLPTEESSTGEELIEQPAEESITGEQSVPESVSESTPELETPPQTESEPESTSPVEQPIGETSQ